MRISSYFLFARAIRYLSKCVEKIVLDCARTDILVLVVLCSFSGYSQNTQLQKYGLDQGLNTSQITAIEQDAIGYLWLGTQGGGLIRFDGKEFTALHKDLTSNFINDLLFTKDTLFIATHQGLSIKRKDRVFNIKSNRINKLYKHLNRLFVATEQGISILKKDYLLPLKLNFQIDLKPVNELVYFKGFYWIATNHGLWKVDNLEKPSSIQKISPLPSTAIEIVNNKLVLGIQNRGVYIVENDRLVSKIERITAITDLNLVADKLYISTKNAGVIIATTDFSIQKRLNLANGLKSLHNHLAFQDQQQRIWIGTAEHGLYKYTENNFKHYDKATGLKANQITAVHANTAGVWLASSNQGVSKIDRLGIQHLNSPLLKTRITAIASDQNKTVWVATQDKGLIRIQEESIALDSVFKNTNGTNSHKTYSFKNISTQDDLLSNHVRTLAIKNDTLWAFTDRGISKLLYDAKRGNIKQLQQFTNKDGIHDLNFNTAVFDAQGRLWYGTNKGDIGYLLNNELRHFYMPFNTTKPINSLVIHKETLFIGTTGIGVWKTSLTKPINISRLLGARDLSTENVYQLQFDNDNQLWLGTQAGVYKVVLDSNNNISKAFFFGKNDGFLGVETSLNAVSKAPDGSLWFGTMNGLTQHLPATANSQDSKPTLKFEDLKVEYQAIDSIPINEYEKTLALKPHQNSISFQFKTVDLDYPNQVEYQWTLNEQVSQWSRASSVDFANLAYGSYRFEVHSRTINKQLSDPIAFEFFIATPWHLQVWFIWSSTAIAVALISLTVLSYIKQLKRKNQRQVEQLALENHLLTLEQKAMQLQMNPHFIFNVLNGIKALGNKGDTEEMNTTIVHFSKLLRGILNNSREEEISLAQEVIVLKNYIALEQQLASNKFTYSIDNQLNNIDIEEILIPPMLLQPFVENSIKHGFKSLEREGILEISFVVKDNFLYCTIKDNGVGLNASKNSKVGHTSVALGITQDRLDSISQENDFKIEELKQNRVVLGTQVSFRIPLKTDF